LHSWWRRRAAPGHTYTIITQATFHRERFQVFPHVNSPALLIKTIINPSQASNA
jgi:hypothetical protein